MLVVGPEGRRLEISRAEQLVDEREGFAVHPMGDIFSPRVPCSRENAEGEWLGGGFGRVRFHGRVAGGMATIALCR